MGLDLDVYLLVGAEYSDVVEEVEEVVSVGTRYNPSTGVPYEATKTKKTWKIADKTFSEEWQAYVTLENAGLCVYEEHGDPVLVGIPADKNTGERVAYGLGGHVSLPEVKQYIEIVSKALTSLGLKDVDVSLRTFSSASY